MLILLWYFQQPTCEVIFHPKELAKRYFAIWACVFLLIGLTKWGKVLFGFVILIAMGTQPLVEYRIPTNESRIVWRLRTMQSNISTSTRPIQGLSDIVDPALFAHGQLSGYIVEFLPRFSQSGRLEDYVIKARPFCYCQTGQRSFVLEQNGNVHYTRADRWASLQDPIVK